MSSFSLPFTIAVLIALASAGAFAGIHLTRVPRLARRILPFSGGLLLGIVAFWIFPEITTHNGTVKAIAEAAAGFGVIVLINRYLYTICPSCATEHDHAGCAQRLHGFAVPLFAAAMVHSFLDGWALAVSRLEGSADLELAFLLGIGLHKIPEGLALGVLFMAALGSAWKAFGSCVLIQCMMMAGVVTAQILANSLGMAGSSILLAAAAGVFVYLGLHAIEPEYQERGLATALMPALTGAAGAAALRLVPGM